MPEVSPVTGHGTAWLIFDAGGDLFMYQCYWFGGQGGDHLLEHARASSATEAVVWAAARTPRARIRMADHRTYWAGQEADPGGFSGVWEPEDRGDRQDAHQGVDPLEAEPAVAYLSQAAPVRRRVPVGAAR